MRKSNTFLEQVNYLIDTHTQHPQLLLLLAQQFQLSPSQIYRKMKRKTGLPPSHYIRHKRLVLAKELVLESDLTLTEIAHLTGFQQLPYFSRCFSKHFGVTASNLRRQVLERV